jgi:SAM-dependent methyltransferase
MDGATGDGNTDRFSGFADLYDANRPSPPRALGPLLVSYANVRRPAVVDLGSGTGLSSRWAAGWAGSVIGIEPNDDMRAIAEQRRTAGVTYAPGVSHRTGLGDRVADIVLAVQAMHWMEPEPTLAEVARLLRPGGVFAIADADWPPVAGIARAEQAWATLHRRIRVSRRGSRAGRPVTSCGVPSPTTTRRSSTRTFVIRTATGRYREACGRGRRASTSTV